ncbi:MAG TPA: hypothetical protein VGA19_06265, partial [Rhodospirillales bacterium]
EAMKTGKRFPILAVLALFLAATLGGCYMPIRFDSEIEIQRTGHYDFKFDGYLAKVELYKDLKERKIGPEEEKKAVEAIKTDFARDPAVKEWKYLKMGHFKVNWHNKGDLIEVKTVSFFNRSSEYLLGISYNRETRRIALSGKSLGKDVKQQLDKAGLGWTGQIRVITDAKVVSHNATHVRDNKRLGGRYKTYTWVIPNIFAPTPSLVIQVL